MRSLASLAPLLAGCGVFVQGAVMVASDPQLALAAYQATLALAAIVFAPGHVQAIAVSAAPLLAVSAH